MFGNDNCLSSYGEVKFHLIDVNDEPPTITTSTQTYVSKNCIIDSLLYSECYICTNRSFEIRSEV